jgi:hypothetical protein
MSVIENFAELSVKEQLDFATALVKTINSENTFTDQTDFKVSGVEADEMTGGLVVMLEHEDYIEVERKATWTCDTNEDSAYEKPEDPDYEDLSFNDAKKVFKTLATELEGYSLTLSVDDVDTEEITEVEVDSVSNEDAGIGHYEFWGEDGYDSQPYCEVEGTLTQACTVYCSLYIEAATHFEAEAEEEN